MYGHCGGFAIIGTKHFQPRRKAANFGPFVLCHILYVIEALHSYARISHLLKKSASGKVESRANLPRFETQNYIAKASNFIKKTNKTNT